MILKLELTVDGNEEIARVSDALLVLSGKEVTSSSIQAVGDVFSPNLNRGDLDALKEALAKSGSPLSIIEGAESDVVTPPPVGAAVPHPEKMTVETVVTPPVTVHAVPSASKSDKCFNCGFYGDSCVCDTAEEETVDTAKVGFGGVAVKPENETVDTANVGFGGSSVPAPSSVGVPQPPSVNTSTTSATSPVAPVPPMNVPNGVVPGANVPTGATPTNPVETDKSGLPWDGRIHAANKSKKTDGNWKAKRGVDPVLVTQVEAELRGGAPTGNAAPTPPAPNTALPEVQEFNQLMQDLGPHLLTETNLQGLSAGELKNFARQLGLVDAATNEGSMKMLINANNLIPAFRALVNAHLAQFGKTLGA